MNNFYLLPRLEAMYSLIRISALEDPHKPYTNEEFELGVEGLKNLIVAREQSILAQSAGAIRIRKARQ
jgi:hypothetical protein